eukprot:TRINITY_DN27821_c0_g1_i1.p1 TRINITY_DN27821_c0_g1~~TRINITY_DN27821_c0_g1_i1.p1  ORF type:complete len:393 (+),score=83.38 TRINITY_DN27821_c0_g1_i1:33-1211(+)
MSFNGDPKPSDNSTNMSFDWNQVSNNTRWSPMFPVASPNLDDPSPSSGLPSGGLGLPANAFSFGPTPFSGQFNISSNIGAQTSPSPISTALPPAKEPANPQQDYQPLQNAFTPFSPYVPHQITIPQKKDNKRVVKNAASAAAPAPSEGPAPHPAPAKLNGTAPTVTPGVKRQASGNPEECQGVEIHYPSHLRDCEDEEIRDLCAEHRIARESLSKFELIGRLLRVFPPSNITEEDLNRFELKELKLMNKGVGLSRKGEKGALVNRLIKFSRFVPGTPATPTTPGTTLNKHLFTNEEFPEIAPNISFCINNNVVTANPKQWTEDPFSPNFYEKNSNSNSPSLQDSEATTTPLNSKKRKHTGWTGNGEIQEVQVAGQTLKVRWKFIMEIQNDED